MNIKHMIKILIFATFQEPYSQRPKNFINKKMIFAFA